MKSGISPFFRNSLAIPDIFYPCKMGELTFLFPKFFHFSCYGCGGSRLDSGSSIFLQKAGWLSQNFPAPHIRTDRKLSAFQGTNVLLQPYDAIFNLIFSQVCRESPYGCVNKLPESLIQYTRDYDVSRDPGGILNGALSLRRGGVFLWKKYQLELMQQ